MLVWKRPLFTKQIYKQIVVTLLKASPFSHMASHRLEQAKWFKHSRSVTKKGLTSISATASPCPDLSIWSHSNPIDFTCKTISSAIMTCLSCFTSAFWASKPTRTDLTPDKETRKKITLIQPLISVPINGQNSGFWQLCSFTAFSDS